MHNTHNSINKKIWYKEFLIIGICDKKEFRIRDYYNIYAIKMDDYSDNIILDEKGSYVFSLKEAKSIIDLLVKDKDKPLAIEHIGEKWDNEKWVWVKIK